MKTKKNIITAIVLLLALPFLIIAAQKIIEIRKQAAPIPANIVVDVTNIQGSLNSAMWRNFAQGGEESKDMIGPVANQVKTLNPNLIRIDHVFDYYDVYQSPGNYNFSRLDQVIESIRSTGANPMISLSYTPASMTTNNQNASEPKNWSDWYNLVKATAYRYSVEKNISNIYYEVWNEPDLFGGWHYAKNPSYTTLFIQTSKAIVDGIGTRNTFKIGGPATTGFYPSWIKSLFKTCHDNQIPLNFISWHKYSKNITDFSADLESLNKILPDFPEFFSIERIITEVGPNPEPDPWYDNSISGIHLLSLTTQLSGKVHKFFIFEIVDGPTPRSDKSTGWGIITHPNNGARPKPRFAAVQFLNQLRGQKIYSIGDGNYVTSLSSREGQNIQTLIVNYDPNNAHYETFPITYKNLVPGQYQLKFNYFQKQTSTRNITVSNNTYSENIFLEPNTAIILELSKK